MSKKLKIIPCIENGNINIKWKFQAYILLLIYAL